MKMIRTIILVLFLGTSILGYSQNKTLYFIVASPEPRNGKYDDEYPAYLAKADSNQLIIIDTLSSEKYLIKHLKVYQEQRMVLLAKEPVKKGTLELVKIDMDNPNKIQSKNLGYKGWMITLIESVLIKDKKNNYNFVLHIAPKNTPIEDRTELFLGINTSDLSITKASADHYARAILTGDSGGLLEGSDDGLRFKNNGEDGKLRIPITYDFSKRPIYEIQLPDTVKLNQNIKSTYLIEANTSEIFIADIDPDRVEYAGKKLTEDNILIFNKKLNKWFNMKLKGSGNRYLPQGKFIAGFVLQGYAPNGYKEEWVSPGNEQRKRTQFETGGSIDYRFQSSGIYQPGILFVIDTETQQYLEWNTGQGDSEILLIENGLITYRVYDKIYQRPLTNMKLGAPKLLLKDEYVPDIHWAFMSK